MVKINNIGERYKLRTTSLENVQEYWEEYAAKVKRDLEEFEATLTDSSEKDYATMSALSFKKSYVDLIEKAVSLEQYKRCDDLYEPTTRMLQIKIDLPRPLIEKYFNLKTISLYGIGLYAPVEGLLLSSSFRWGSNYDASLSPLKSAPRFDISKIPVEIQNEYAFRLAIPASDGLFVPKVCDMTTNWLYTIRQLEYFDLS